MSCATSSCGPKDHPALLRLGLPRPVSCGAKIGDAVHDSVVLPAWEDIFQHDQLGVAEVAQLEDLCEVGCSVVL